MKSYPRSLKMVQLATVLLGAISLAQGAAPLVGAAVGAAGGATGGIAGAPAAALGGAAGAAQVGRTGGGADFGSGLNSGMSGVGNVGSVDSLSASQDRLRTQAEFDSKNAALLPGLTFAPDASGSVVLDAGPVASQVRGAALETRQKVMAEMDARIEASARAMVALQKSSEQLKGTAQADFKAAVKEAGARESQLKKSLKAAGKAKADTWGKARSDVAADYEAYAAAVTHAEAVASAGGAKPTGAVENKTTGNLTSK
jgi:hypothetical protein